MKIKIEISEDEKEASLIIVRDESEEEIPLADDLKAALKDAGVNTGIDDSELELICFDKKYNTGIVVAKCIDPQTGENASIEKINAPVEKDKIKPIIKENGSIDYYAPRKGLIPYVKKGDIIIKKKPPTIGDPGKTVLGKEIPGISGKDILIDQFCGGNIEIQGDSLISAIEGIVQFSQDKYSVEKEFKIKSGVGLETGSIEIPLDSGVELVVDGDIQDGYKVSCTTLKVGGCVEDAVINVKNLFIKEGIVGTSELPISADVIRVGFINGPRKVYAKYLKVSREISTGAEIFSDIVNAADIMGSTIIAKEAIWADSINGSNKIFIGIDYKVKEEFDRLSKEITMMEKNIEEMEQGSYKIAKRMEKMKQLAKINPKNPSLVKELLEIKKFKEKHNSFITTFDELKTERSKSADKMYLFKNSFLLIKSGFSNDNSSGQIIALDTSIRICTHSMRITEPAAGGVYNADESGINFNQKYNIVQYKNIIEKKIKSL